MLGEFSQQLQFPRHCVHTPKPTKFIVIVDDIVTQQLCICINVPLNEVSLSSWQTSRRVVSHTWPELKGKYSLYNIAIWLSSDQRCFLLFITFVFMGMIL